MILQTTVVRSSLLSMMCLAPLMAQTPTATVRKVETYRLPGVYREGKKSQGYVDCNSPAHWDGETMYLFSSDGVPWRTSGPDLLHLEAQSQLTKYDNQVNGGRWVEATYKDASGKLYGWYHREPAGLCQGTHLTAPLIGAVTSQDNGMTWHDLGTVLRDPGEINCKTANKYFAGGNGDFSVILDGRREYFYFFIGTYNPDQAHQGVAVARMKFEDRDHPVGKVLKWHVTDEGKGDTERGAKAPAAGPWGEPGIDGQLTPIYPPRVDWHKEDADVFWGPSVHFNTHLKQYVMLLNRSKDKNWTQEGVYVAFNPDIENPRGWSKPAKILDAAQLDNSKWYPQVVGTDAAAHETDKLAGKTARLFVAGVSKWEITFEPGR